MELYICISLQHAYRDMALRKTNKDVTAQIEHIYVGIKSNTIKYASDFIGIHFNAF